MRFFTLPFCTSSATWQILISLLLLCPLTDTVRAQGAPFNTGCGSATSSTIVGQSGFTAVAPGNTRTITFSDFGIDPTTINAPTEVNVYFDNDAVTQVIFTTENGAIVTGAVGDHFVIATLPNDGSTFISATATIVATGGRTAEQNAEDVSFFGLVLTDAGINDATSGALTQDIEVFNECAPVGSFPLDLSGDPDELFDFDLQIGISEVEPGDPRTITFTITACGTVLEETVNVEPLPGFVDGFGIYETTFTNIPGDCDKVTYEFCSNPGEQSYGVGFLGANYQCVTCFQVDPDLDVDDVPNQSLCNGDGFVELPFTADDITVNFSSTNPMTRDIEQQFSWTNSNPAIGLGTSGTGAIPAFTAVNNTDAPVSATITVTPFTEDPDCVGNPETFTITVNPSATLTDGGDNTLCIDQTDQLVFSGTSGTFTSSDNGVATVSGTGLVTGAGPGMATITYTDDNGCEATTDYTVNPSPTLAGAEVCVGNTVTVTGSGTPAATNPYVSSNTNVATVTDAGVVTGVAPGTTDITYTDNNGCMVTATVGVNELPTVMGGEVCVNNTFQLTFTNGPGAFTSNNTAVASVDNTGLVTGESAGTVTIDYEDQNGCMASATITVNPLPVVEDDEVCVDDSKTLTFTNTPGNFSSSDNAIASVDNAGTITGQASGVVTITYTDDNGCVDDATVTVNALPTVEDAAVCVDDAIMLTFTNTPMSFTSGNTGVATVNGSGVVVGVSAGSTTITITDINGCTGAATVTVNPLPTLADGAVCIGETITLTGSGTPAATDPYVSSNPGVATVNASGEVTGVSAGMTTITYTDDNTCSATATVTVNAPPTLEGGEVCVDKTITLTGSGTPAANDAYVSADPDVATVTSAGVVTGISEGDVVITYTDDNGCSAEATVIVNPLPTLTGGEVCVGDMLMLIATNMPAAMDAYVSSAENIATVSGSGVVTGISAGTATMTFTDSNGCTITSSVTVNALPTLEGGAVCVGETITLTGSGTAAADAPYTSSAPAIATVDAAGVVTGVAAGSVVITYTDENGCMAEADVTVNALPTLADDNVCLGGMVSIAGSGTPAAVDPYVSSDPAVASITDAGVVEGVSVGTATITYTDANGCTATAEIRVDPLPTLEPLTICEGETDEPLTFTGMPGGFTSDDIMVATVNDMGLVNGVGEGTATIIFTDENGCEATAEVIVNPNPTVSPSQNVVIVCNGEDTPEITFTSNVAGAVFTYTIDNLAVGLVPPTGTGNVPSFTAVNNGITPIVANIIVSTNATANGQECSGAMTTIQVTIDPTPTVDPVADQTTCAGDMTAEIVFSGDVAGTMYSWTNDNPSIGLAASGMGDIASFTTLNTGTTAQVANIEVTPLLETLGGAPCTGDPESFTIAVNPTPTVDPVEDQEICLDGMTTEVVFSGAVAGAMFSYSAMGDDIGVPADEGNGSLPTFTPTAAGTATITVTPTTPGTTPVCSGPPETFTITVNPLPTLTGDDRICLNDMTFLTGSGMPAMTDPYVSSNTTVASVSDGGVVTGLQPGTSTITYTDANGCEASLDVTVDPLPTLPTASVCFGDEVTMVGSGTPAADMAYVSANPNIATITDAGVATGVSAGTATITYTDENGCQTTADLTVNPLPTLMGGRVCVDDMITLFGTNPPAQADPYVSSDPSVASITNAGVLTGISSGTVTITFTDENGCQATAEVMVDELPTLTGGSVCVGDMLTLVASGTPNAMMPFISDAPAIASVSSAGIVSGLTAGTATITYTDENGCTATAGVTVDPLPTLEGGEVCIGNTIALSGSGSPATTLPYESADPSIATVNEAGTVTGVAAGVVDITYTDENGCSTTAEVTVNALPTLEDGEVCVDESITVSGSGVPASAMPYVSSNPAVATVDDDGLVTGVSAGATTISYTDENGCQADATITVNALPTVTGGEVCVNQTLTVMGSGAPAMELPYVSSDPSVASVDANGLVSGLSPGVVTITYTDDNSCTAESTVTVNVLPTLVGGEVCIGETITLTGSPTPNTTDPYVSSDPSVATIDENGLVTGIAAGTTTITYINDDGCFTTAEVTVNPLPSLVGGEVCLGETITLTGTGVPATTNPYVSSAPSIATVSFGGVVEGVMSGIATITYTDNAGCTTSAEVTVNDLPIINGGEVCVGTSIEVNGSGTPAADMPYVSSDESIATVSSLGSVTGLAPGTVTITYTDDNGCQNSAEVIVNAPPTITGPDLVCIGEMITLTGSGIPFAIAPYLSSETEVATITDNGVVMGLSPGVTTISYTDDNGCLAVFDVTVSPAPTVTVMDAEACINDDATFTATATPASGGEIAYQWQIEMNGSFDDLPGETASTLTVENVNLAQDGDRYRVIVTETTPESACSSIIDAIGVLSVNELPVCDINGPTMVNTNAQDIEYSELATGVSYQWALIGGDATIDGPSDQQTVLIDFGVEAPIIQITVGDPNGCTRTCELRIEVSILTLGSTVFEDTNNNGVQDDGEPGISNVPIELYNAATDGLILIGPNGILGDADDGTTEPLLTDADGNYLFQNLTPGDYYVSIPGTAFEAGGPLETSNISSNTTTSGFMEIDPNAGNVDGDDNGIQNGAATQINSQPVTLEAGTEPTGTDEPGQGGDQDDALQDENGNMTLDLGVFAPVRIGGVSFIDLNDNDSQDPTDAVLGNVTATVFNADGSPVTVAADGSPYDATVPTDENGEYLFDNLPPGDYFVSFDISTADNADLYTYVAANVGDEGNDSDAIPSNETESSTGPTVVLNSGEEDLMSQDVGVRCNISVTVAEPFTICRTQPIDLTRNAAIVPPSLGGTWSTPDGDGTFTTGTPFGFATTYVPGDGDASRGSVTLVLTTTDPASLTVPSPCQQVSASVVIDILQVDCGDFFWDGGE